MPQSGNHCWDLKGGSVSASDRNQANDFPKTSHIKFPSQLTAP
jgi:hypothetical protein